MWKRQGSKVSGLKILSHKLPGRTEEMYDERQLIATADLRTEVRNGESLEPTYFHRSYVLPSLLQCLKYGEISNVVTNQDVGSAPNHTVQ
jgi:hypothetical protein